MPSKLPGHFTVSRLILINFLPAHVAIGIGFDELDKLHREFEKDGFVVINFSPINKIREWNRVFRQAGFEMKCYEDNLFWSTYDLRYGRSFLSCPNLLISNGRIIRKNIDISKLSNRIRSFLAYNEQDEIIW